MADSRSDGAHLHGVSFFHGSNDGQKGMGLIMLILIGTVPTAYALNHAGHRLAMFRSSSPPVSGGLVLDRHVDRNGISARCPLR